MSFGDLKGCLRSAGVTLSDRDFEMVWRRVDIDCLGVVTYDKVATAFELTDRRSVGEPGGSRALPHFKRADGAGEEDKVLPFEKDPRQVASNLAVERIARAIVGGAPAPGHTSESINHEGGRHHYSKHTYPTEPKPKSASHAKVWDVVKETLARHPQHLTG